MVPGLPRPPDDNDTTPTEGCPYCARCTVGEDCPWCGKQSLCDLCGVCFTEDCGYTRPEEVVEVADLLKEAGQERRDYGRELFRRVTVPLDELREGGA